MQVHLLGDPVFQWPQQPGKNGLSTGVDSVALALATELTELRDQLDRRTGQCLEYRALALELDEALKEAEARIEELEMELVEAQETSLCASMGCTNSQSPYCPDCHG